MTVTWPFRERPEVSLVRLAVALVSYVLSCWTEEVQSTVSVKAMCPTSY